MPNVLNIPIPTQSPALVWPGRPGQAPGVNTLLLMNTDPTSTVYIGQTASITAAGDNTIPLSPNGSISVDPNSSWYVIGSDAGTQPLVMVPNGQNYFLPASLSGLGGAKVFVQSATPTGIIPVNSLWFNTGTGALEVWTGTAWDVQQFNAQQLIQADTILAAQIANGTLTAAQLAAAAGILGTQIAAATITSGNIAANTIVAANIAANTITAAQIDASSLIANIIDGATITGNTINGAVFNGTNWIQNANGSFFYNGTPALGNLIASVTPLSSLTSGGTDQFGNVYYSGTCTYQANGTANAPLISQMYFGSVLVGNGAGIIGTGGASAAGINGDSANGYLAMSSGQQSGSDFFAVLELLSKATSPSNQAILSAFNPLQMFETATVPTVPAGNATLFAGTTGNFNYVNPGDGNAYSMGRFTNPTTGTITINSTSPITILSVPVQAGKYRVSLKIVYVGGATASSAIVSCANGTATVSNTLGKVTRARASTNADLVSIINQNSAIGGLSLAFNASELETYEFDGIITFSAAGTFVVTGAETTSGDTWAVATNSYIDLMPVTH